MKRTMIALAAAAALFVLPSLGAAAGLPGVTVLVLNPTDGVAFGTAQTDELGAFAFEGLPVGSWLLGVASPDGARQAWLNFSVPAEKAPARLAGNVSTLDGADLSLEVNATVAGALDEPLPPPPPPEPAEIVLDEGYPRLQRAWNLNWGHANGKLLVRLAGTGLDGLAKVSLTSPAGSIETTAIYQDPETGVFVAVFAKKAAFAALVPADAVRGDAVALVVGVTATAGEASFDATVRIVGPKRPRKP